MHYFWIFFKSQIPEGVCQFFFLNSYLPLVDHHWSQQMMHFASRLAIISIALSITYAVSLDFTSFHGDLSSGEEGPLDAGLGATTTVTDGSQVLAEQSPPYIPPPIPSVGSDHLGDLFKDTIKQANPNSQQPSFTPQDPEMALVLPSPTGPSTSPMNPQPVTSIPLSSYPSPDFDVDPSLSWSSYKDDQSLGTAESIKSADWTTKHSCHPQVAPNSRFRARGESCTAPQQIIIPEQESVPPKPEKNVPERERVPPKQDSVPPRQESVPPKQNHRRKKICPQDIIALCCEEKGDFFFVWFPKKCKRCEWEGGVGSQKETGPSGDYFSKLLTLYRF